MVLADLLYRVQPYFCNKTEIANSFSSTKVVSALKKVATFLSELCLFFVQPVHARLDHLPNLLLLVGVCAGGNDRSRAVTVAKMRLHVAILVLCQKIIKMSETQKSNDRKHVILNYIKGF